MIRDSVLFWGSVGLLVLLAFILLPTYERYKNILGQPEPVPQKDPRAAKGWLAPTGMYEDKRIGEDYLANEGFGNWFVWPIRESFQEGDAAFDSVTPENAPLPLPDLPKSTTVTSIPPPSTVMSDKPSGVKTIPSVLPPPPTLPSSPFVNDTISSVGLDKRVINNTIPAPNFDNPFHPSGKGDKYVLKSSLVPCSCAAGQGMSCSQHGGSYPSSVVPGDQDMGGIIGGDDGIRKPFSVAFDAETNPSGYLNSFAAFK
jgi:hypothetical protein